MMALTHALLGAVLALPLAAVAPELAPVALVAGAAGGVAPDLDIYADHRRRLHFPVFGPLAAVPALGLAAAAPGPATVALAWFLAAAGVHAAADVLGGGLELRPWQGTSERAVYSHYHGRWLAPRRLVAYDGSPGDLGLAAAAGATLVLAFGATVELLGAAVPLATAVGAVLAVAAGYTLLRKPLADLWAAVVVLLPAPVRGRLPERFADL